jgi:hypothetical protein
LPGALAFLIAHAADTALEHASRLSAQARGHEDMLQPLDILHSFIEEQPCQVTDSDSVCRGGLKHDTMAGLDPSW